MTFAGRRTQAQHGTNVDVKVVQMGEADAVNTRWLGICQAPVNQARRIDQSREQLDWVVESMPEG